MERPVRKIPEGKIKTLLQRSEDLAHFVREVTVVFGAVVRKRNNLSESEMLSELDDKASLLVLEMRKHGYRGLHAGEYDLK